jgi:hypothetical protein
MEATFQEWIEFHLLMGVEHFFLYAGQSLPGDNWPEVLQPYIDEGLVTVSPQYTGFSPQGLSYEHCLSEHYLDSHWLMFIDVDEYMVVKEPYHNFSELLHEFEEHPGNTVVKLWFVTEITSLCRTSCALEDLWAFWTH